MSILAFTSTASLLLPSSLLSRGFHNFGKGLEKTKESVFSKLARAVAGKSTVDDDVLDDLAVYSSPTEKGCAHGASGQD